MRVKQMLGIALLAIAASATASVVRGPWLNAGLLALAAAVLLGGWTCAHRGRLALATSTLLAALTTMVTLLVWRNAGVRDPAMLAYPGILVIASILGRRDLLVKLSALIAIVIVAVVLGNVQGWHVNVVPAASLHDLVDPLAILAGTGSIVWMMAADLHLALRNSQLENARVRESQARIEFIATHDALTGLANRVLARDLFDHEVAAAQRRRNRLGLLHLDLDDFKTVNDSLGHAAGDELLRQVGTRLAGALRGTDTVCRLGGDEFLVLLGELEDGDAAAEVARKVLAQFATPFHVSGLDVSSACSMGIAMYPDDGGDFDTLLKHADTAMYRAKEEGHNAYRFFDPAMNASILEHVNLASALRTALAREEFVLHYQPQFDLATNRIVGAEALIRWHHPELGLVPPARFIPVAEKAGLIVPIGAWVLREACRQAMAWQAAGLDGLVVAVNVSPIQFHRGDIDVVVLNALHETGLHPARLELELTESLFLQDSAALSAAIGKLRQTGVSLSIDDFGTGYSNLGYLKRFEVERLKVDQSFVRRMHADPHDEAIVRAIVQMSQSLGLTTIAEGIEDPQTRERLVALGCDEGQGYLWSRPLPAQEFLAFARALTPAGPSAPAHGAAAERSAGPGDDHGQ